MLLVSSAHRIGSIIPFMDPDEAECSAVNDNNNVCDALPNELNSRLKKLIEHDPTIIGMTVSTRNS
jgi:hypothetical protein